jgi:hypothetical protein
MDVPSFLKGFAVNSVMCNYDSYNGSLAHNYYLMYTNGKHYFVGWDYNLCLGNFMDGGSSVNSDVTTSLYQATVDNRPFAKLLQIPEYYDMYVGYVKDIMNLYSDPEKYVSNYASKIRSHVQADPLAGFTIDQFDKCTSKSANGLQVNDNGQSGWNWNNGQNGQNNGFDWNNWNNGQNGQNNGFDWSNWNNGQNGQWNFQFNSNEPEGEETSFEDSWAFEGGFGDWNGGGWNGGVWNGNGGGGFFGGGDVSVVDFLIKRFEVIRSSLRM